MGEEGIPLLITIEGIDGSGKSTLVSALRESLKDLDPVFTREPGSTWVGDAVRRAIAERVDPVTEALLFVADHAAHLETVVRPALDGERMVISDRYTDSRYAYQGVMLEGKIPDPLALAPCPPQRLDCGSRQDLPPPHPRGEGHTTAARGQTAGALRGRPLPGEGPAELPRPCRGRARPLRPRGCTPPCR